MRTTSPSFTSSLYGLLTGQTSKASLAWREERTEDIRQEMLACLEQPGVAGFRCLLRRIDGAPDAAALWYLRSSLMAALCVLRDEQRANETLVELSRMFDGVLPRALCSRPSPLATGPARVRQVRVTPACATVQVFAHH